MILLRCALICIVLPRLWQPAKSARATLCHFAAPIASDYSASRPLGQGQLSSWTPSQTDIEGLESRLSQISRLKIRGWESTPIRIDHPEKYFRQYVGVKHNGKREIYINAFDDDPPPQDWRTRLYVVSDGDIGYWHAFYDPDTKIFSDLTINYRA